MALQTCEMNSNDVKMASLFFFEKSQNTLGGWGAPQFPKYDTLYFGRLFNTLPMDTFFNQKIFNFWFKPLLPQQNPGCTSGSSKIPNQTFNFFSKKEPLASK